MSLGMKPVVIFSLLAIVALTKCQQPSSDPEVVHEWVKAEYDWPSEAVKQEYISNGWYTLQDSAPVSSVSIYGDDIYVTALRFNADTHIPSGLNKVVVKNGKSLLQPYPNLEMNKLGDCSHIIFPFAITIDPNTGLLYAIDVGRVSYGVASVDDACPAKLVVLDLEDNGRIVRSHELPESVAAKTSNGVNDLVLDYGSKNGKQVEYVYITDTLNAKLIVFDMNTNTSWAFHDDSMLTDSDKDVVINGVNYTFNFYINGIAMDADFENVYYSAVGSKNLYQVPTFVLRDSSWDFSLYRRLVGPKISNSGGLTCGQNNLYYGTVTLNAIYKWEMTKDLHDYAGNDKCDLTLITETEIAKDDVKFIFPDAITLDTKGYLWFTTDRFNLLSTGTMDFTGGQGSNFRINRMFVSDVSYLSLKPNSPVVG